MSIRPLSIKQVDEPQIADELVLSPEARKLPSPSSSSPPVKKCLTRFLSSMSSNLGWISKATSVNKQAPRPMVSNNSPSLDGLKTQSPIPSPEEQQAPSPSSSSSFGTNRLVRDSSFADFQQPSPPPSFSSSPSYPSPSPSLSPLSPYTEKRSYAKVPSSRSPSPRSPSNPRSPLKLRDNNPNNVSPRSFSPMLKESFYPRKPAKKPIDNASKLSSASPRNQYTANLLLQDLYGIIEAQQKHVTRMELTSINLSQNYNSYSPKEIADLIQEIIQEGREILFPLHKIFTDKLNTTVPQKTITDNGYIQYYASCERSVFTWAFFATMDYLEVELRLALSSNENFNSCISKLANMTNTVLRAQNTKCLNETDISKSIITILENVEFFVKFITLNFPKQEHFKLKAKALKTVAPLCEGNEEMFNRLKSMIFFT